MKKRLNEWENEFKTAVSLGTFDGVHLGHKKLFGEMRKTARKLDLESLVFTFSQPPKNYLDGNIDLILLPEEKLKLLENEGAHLVIADFVDIREMPPEDFIKKILIQRLNMEALIVGANYRFGRNRKGDVKTLQRLSVKYDFKLKRVTFKKKDGQPISSTKIRQTLRKGDVENAHKLLGYYPHLYGAVVPGEMRGRKLGFPTLNLEIDKRLIIPTQGVFAAYTYLSEDRNANSLMYIGNRPTFDGKKKTFEIHLLNSKIAENLYGERIQVTLLKKMREDRRFPNSESLQRQMEKDVKKAENFFQSALSPSV